jgi:hypothetical protein
LMLVAVGRGANVGRLCSLALISMKSTGGGTIVVVGPFLDVGSTLLLRSWALLSF